MNPFALVFILVWAITVYVLIQHIRAKRHEALDMNYAATISMPVLVTSNFARDKTVHQRAERWRADLKASGNRWADTIPIVVIPFRGVPELRGKIGAKATEASKAFRTFDVSWHEYTLESVEVWKAACIDWQTHVSREMGAHAANQVFTGQEVGKGKFQWGAW